MNNTLNNKELEIPNFISIKELLDCENCANTECEFKRDCEYLESEYDCENCANTECEFKKDCEYLESKYDCEDFMFTVFMAKILIEAIIFIGLIFISLFPFKGFWLTTLKVVLTFVALLLVDFGSDKLIKLYCINSEKKRKQEYDINVQKIKEDNEAIRKANLGLTEEAQKFFDNSNHLLNELSNIYDSLKNVLNVESKDEKRVINKFQDVLEELEVLNGKLSTNNFESSYITTLYELHLPKLLEYSNDFLKYHNSGTLTSKQIVEFAKLLEVFRAKLSNHTEYLQNKIEDDFLIKMKALNEDVIPNYDGSEVDGDE